MNQVAQAKEQEYNYLVIHPSLADKFEEEMLKACRKMARDYDYIFFSSWFFGDSNGFGDCFGEALHLASISNLRYKFPESDWDDFGEEVIEIEEEIINDDLAQFESDVFEDLEKLLNRHQIFVVQLGVNDFSDPWGNHHCAEEPISYSNSPLQEVW